MAWPELAIKDVQIHINNGKESKQLNLKKSQLKVGSELSVKALVRLGRISPDDVSIELYHGPVDAWGDIKDGSSVRMDYKESSGRDGEHWFAGLMSCKTSGRRGVTVRILPRHPDLINPYEPGLILWETTDIKSSLTAN